MVFNSDIRNNFVQYGQSLSMLKNITGDVATQTDVYAKAVSLLTPKQQALALATQNLTIAQIAEVMKHNELTEVQIAEALSSAHLINKKKELSIVLAQETLMSAGLEETKALSIMNSAGIVASDGAETVSKKQVSVATLEAKLAEEGLSASQIKLITTQMGLGTSTVALSNYFKGLAASTWASVEAIGAFLVTNPVGWCILAAGAIAGVVAGVNAYNKAINEGIEKANEAYNKTSENISGIEEYKDKITELKNALADEITSEEDAYNARKQLVEIQDEIVSKYGLQKDSIDLVNDSLREEIALLDELSTKKAADFLRENKKDIENAKKKVEKEKSFSFGISYNDFQNTRGLSGSLMTNGFGKFNNSTIDYNFQGTTDGAIKYYSKLYDYIEEYKEKNIDLLNDTEDGVKNIDKILTAVSEKIKAVNNENYQNAKQLYDSATQSELQSNDNYRNIYKATIDARQAYQEAIAQGNENAIYKSIDDMEKAKADFQKSVNDGKIVDFGVSEWFTDFYKDFETESGKYQFTVDIKANSDGLKNSVQETLKYFGDKTPTELDILNLEFSGSEKAQETFKALDDIAKQYGISIEDLIAVLEQLEIVQIDAQDVDVTGQVVSQVKSDLAKVQAEIEDIFKNTDIFDKAIESLNKGEAVDFDTMMSMVEVDSSLADKFTKTADGYTIAVGTLTRARQEYIKSTQEQLQADIALAKQQAVVAEQNIKDLEAKRDALLKNGINSKSDAELLNQYNNAIETEKQNLQDLNDVASKSSLYLSELASSALGTVSCFEKSQNAISGMEEKTSLLKKAMTEMRDAGSISADTYAELASKGADYVNCLEIQNGKLVLNTEKLKDLDTAALKTAITTNELAMAQINASMAGHEWSEALKEEYNNIELATAALRDKLNEYNNTKPDEDKSGGSSSSDDKPESILDFETELARRQHEIKMGRMQEDETYFNWLEKAYREAYKGLTGYQDDIYKYEEMVYDGCQKLAEDFYNEQKKYHEDRVEELESQITVTEDKSVDKNGNSLNPSEKFDYIRATYSELISEIERRINEIVQSGIEGHEDEVKELEKQIEEYSDKLQDVFKDEIDYEIKYIEITRDKYNDFIDSRIERYEDEKKAIEDKYDTEIKSIDDTIGALKDKNDATSKAIELKKAEQDLDNAKQRTRKVYGADGTIIYTQDTNKIEETQQKVDDIKLDMLIDSLEQQKEAKEAEKDAALEKYDTMITDLEAQKSSQDEFFKSVLEKLDNINNPKPTESIDRIIDKAYADDLKEAEKVKQKLKDNYVENSDKKNSNKSNDDTVKKASLSKTETNSANENKDNVQIEQTSNYDSFMKLVYSMSGKEPDGYERWKRGEYDESNKLMGNIFSDDAFMGGVMKPFEDAMNSFNETSAKASVTTVEKQQPVNVTFSGGINIQNPVGEVHQFAKELLLQLPTAFRRQMYTNLK